MVRNILPLPFFHPCNIQEMEKAFIWLQATPRCDQKLPPVFNGLLQGQVYFLHQLISFHIQMEQVHVIDV
jgi:hypothetical protein